MLSLAAAHELFQPGRVADVGAGCSMGVRFASKLGGWCSDSNSRSVCA